VMPSAIGCCQFSGASANARPALTATNFTAAISSWSSGAGAPRSRPGLRRVAVSSSYHAGLYVGDGTREPSAGAREC
jgi:hypothetical protein